MAKYLWGLLFLSYTTCFAQQNTLNGLPFDQIKQSSTDEELVHKNILKINLYSLLVKNYSLSFERLISRKISLQLSYRYGPYAYWVNNLVGRKIVKHGIGDPKYYGFQVSNNAVTTDLRFYLGRKEGMRGLFLGLYGRYATFDADNLDFNYVTEAERIYSVPLVINSKGIAGGIIVGRQWIIKKRITLECISGVQYGKLNGSLISNKDLSSLSEIEKNDLKDNIAEMFIILNKNYLPTLTVNNTGVNGKISGPFIGIRSALSIGFAF
jgi:hypothetical protein